MSGAKQFLPALFFAAAFFFGFTFATTTAKANAPTCSAADYVDQSFMGRNIRSGFGTREAGRTTNGNRMSSFHRALDLRVTDNPNVGAFHGGTVVHAGTMGGWGNTVIVRNGNFEVQYGHAGSMNVQVGQTVNAGQNLGNWANCSGNCTGPHVDVIYRVNNNGTWSNVDPIIAERLISEGLTPGSDEFNQRALDETANRCSTDPNALTHDEKTGPGGTTEYGEMCDENIFADVSAQVDGAFAKREDFVAANFTPPPSVNQVANTPCKSKELQRISNQFANAPSQYLTGISSGLLSAGGPVSGIMQKLFAADFESINKAASFLPQMLNFQSQASSILSGLLGSLGLSDAFSSDVCGLMVDMLLKYVQCENPIELPQLGNMFGSLNDLLPDGCAGEALRSGLMEAGNMQSLKTTNQPILFSGGRFVPGNADEIPARSSTAE